ncbi:MAG: integrase [Spirochaetaceae bacterium]|nr:MAG: integrase [Spirochaetaceae bacterium]
MGSATIMQLSQAVLDELQRLGYAVQTIAVYRGLYARLLRFAEANGTEQYSEEICQRWLKESMEIDATRVVTGTDPVYRRENYQPIRVCQCLTEWHLHGCLPLKKQGKLAALPVPRGFRNAYDSYVEFCHDSGYSQRGVYTRLNRIKRMLLFLDQHGVSDLKAITAREISAFLKSQIELDSRTVATMLVACRAFFRHLKRTGLTDDELAEKLPKIKANRQFRLPRVWRREDVLAVLNSIDRGSPVGKRDYAILLLITRYGLRSLDVRTLKLSSLRWNENLIEIVQSKTGEPLRLPLLQDVGWAIIDYLRNGRPPSPLPEVFLTSTVPFRPFGVHSCGLNAILAKRVRQAGVAFPRDVPKGVHALRHTLASLMLAQGVELPVISAVLGHLSSESTGVYLHTDIEALRQCALDPEEVLSHERQ